MSQRNFVQLIGISEVSVFNYESGRRIPRLSTIAKIVEVTGVDAAWLIGVPGTTTWGKENPRVERLQQELDEKNAQITALTESLAKLKKHSMKIQCKGCFGMFEISIGERYDAHPCPKCGCVNYTEVKISASQRAGMEYYTNSQTAAPPPHIEEESRPRDGDLYFDIETTGLSRDVSKITVICWIAGNDLHTWVNNKTHSASPDEFLQAWNNASRVITFNGATFDIPMLQKYYDVPSKPHMDMMVFMRMCGQPGRLKDVEKRCGMERLSTIADWKGVDAVNAWNGYARDGDVRMRDLLQVYCACDVFSIYQFHQTFACKSECLPDGIVETINALSCELEKLHNSANATANLDEFTVPEGWVPTMPGDVTDGMQIRDLWAIRRASPLTAISGASVCITGDTTIPREVLHEIIAAHGGQPSKNVTRTTDFLVVADAPGKTKIAAAEKNISNGAHTRIICENELVTLIKAARNFKEVTEGE